MKALPADDARPEANQQIDPRELRQYLRQHLSPQKTPVVWCQLDGFPLTGAGKIQKFALRDGYLAGDYVAIGEERKAAE